MIEETIIEETIFGSCPSKSNSYKIGKHGMYKSKSLTDYEKKFFIQCKSRGRKVDGYFEFEMNVFYPSERADLDNSLKIVLDCLQKYYVIVNDNKCISIRCKKFLDKANPRIELKVIPV